MKALILTVFFLLLLGTATAQYSNTDQQVDPMQSLKDSSQVLNTEDYYRIQDSILEKERSDSLIWEQRNHGF